MNQLESTTNQMSISNYWRVIKSRKWIIIIAFITTVVTTGVGSYMMIPTYESTATLILDYTSSNPLDIQSAGGINSGEYIQTQVGIIKSRNVAGRVVDSLGLASHPYIIESFNKSKERRGFLSSLLHIARKDKRDKREADIKTWLAAYLLSSISVEPERDTRLLHITFKSPNPDFSAQIANAFARAYAQYNLELKISPLRDAVDWLEVKVQSLKKSANKADEELIEYKKETGLISQHDRYNDPMQKFEQLNRELIASEIRYDDIMIKKGHMDKMRMSGSFDSLPEVISNSLIQNLKVDSIRIEKKLSELSDKVGINHPQYIQAQSEFRTIKEKMAVEIQNIVDAIDSEYRSTAQRREVLRKAVEKQRKTVLDLNKERSEAVSLSMDADTFRKIYEVILTKYNETALRGDINRTNIFIMDMAESPTKPSSPKIFLNMALAVVIGGFLGIGLAFLFEYMDTTIKTVDEIESYYKIPVLGTLPGK